MRWSSLVRAWAWYRRHFVPSAAEATDPALPYLVTLAALWAVGVLLGGTVLDRFGFVLPAFPVGKLAVAAAVAVWILFGAKPAERAYAFFYHRVSTSRAWFHTALVLPLVLIGSSLYLLYLSEPMRYVSALLREEAMAAEPVDTGFFEPCLTLEPMPQSQAGVSGQLLNRFGGGCSDHPITSLLSLRQPLFLLGDPAVGKFYLLKKLRGVLARQGEPSILVVMRECRPPSLQSVTLEDCARGVIQGAIARFVPSTSVSDVAAEYERQTTWWLLIDGIDDPGDEALVVPLLRELTKIHRARQHRVIVNGRAQHLADIVYRQGVDDELRSVFSTFQRVGLKGLTERGSQDFIEYLDRVKPGAMSLKWLERMASCDGAAGAFADEIRHVPGLLRDLSEYPERLEPDSLCAEPTRSKVARWVLQRRFEAYCRAAVCGTEDRKAALRQSWTQSLRTLLILSATMDVVTRDVLIVSLKDANDLEKILRGLVETGVLVVVGFNRFKIRRHWLPA